MRGTLLRASLAVGVCLLAAPSAGATPPGLHVDPASPGGKEYAIPLDQARDDASGGGGGSQSSGGGSGSHLFGVGVGGSDGGSSGSAGTGGSGAGGGSNDGKSGGSGSGGSGGSDRSGGSDSGSSGARNRLSTLSVAAANPESGAQAPLLVLGGSAGIVLAGVLLGLMFRRRRISGGPSA
jgi:hypothetical protein